jgi:hypothetical protein
MAATYTKPTSIPRWNDTGGNRVNPPAAKKDLGWVFQEIPPSSFENWRTNLIGEWIKWLDERTDDADAGDSLVINDAGVGGAHTTFRTGGQILFSGEFEQDQVLLNGTTSADPKGMWYSGDQLTSSNRTGAPGLSYVQDESDLRHTWIIAATDEAFLTDDGLRIQAGLHVGNLGQTPINEGISAGNDTAFRMQGDTNPYLNFAHGAGNEDRLLYDRTANAFQFQILGSDYFVIDTSGIDTIAGFADYRLTGSGNDRQVVFAPNDYLNYEITANRYDFYVNSVPEVRINANGMRVDGGLYVGEISGALVDASIIVDDDIRMGGGLSVGSTGADMPAGVIRATSDVRLDGGLAVGDMTQDVNAGDAMITGGLAVGFTNTNPADDSVEVGDVDFGLQFVSGVDLRLNFDKANNDRFAYNRSSNEFSMVIGGTPQYIFDGVSIQPATALLNDLGTTGARWNHGYIDSLFVYEDDNAPDITDHPWQLNKNNCVSFVARANSGGGSPTVGAEWNISSITKNSVGNYTIILLEGGSGGTGIVPFLSFLSAAVYGHCSVILDDRVDVFTFSQFAVGTPIDADYLLMGFSDP